MTKERFFSAPTFLEFLESVEHYRDLWPSVYARAKVPRDIVDAARRAGRYHLLAVAGDWCGDAVDPLPYVARLAEEVERFEFRTVDRDANRDLMEGHLTNGALSVPIVIVYDGAFNEVGYWGPRPAPLQEWVELARKEGMSSRERFLASRRWYVQDRGRTTLQELLCLLDVAV